MSLPAYRIPPNLEGKADPSVVRAIRHIDKIVNEHEQAFAALGTQSTVASSKASVVNETINETTSTIAGVSSFNSATGSVSYFPALGVVNPQTGLTTYTTQTSDNGLIVLLNDSSPIAVTLNSTVSNPYFTTISNQGSGTATLTPSTGQVNGLASITVSGGSFATVYFDGNNWWAENPGSSVGGVTQIVAGTNVTVSPAGGTGIVTVNSTASGGVTQIIAGTNVTISPAGGTGAVTVNSSGSGGLPVNNPTFTGAITGPHYDSNGATPTIVVGPAAGVGGSASFVLATSTDAAGVVGISTGTGTTTGVLATVTFATPYPTNAIVLMNYGVQGTTITSSGFSPTSFQVVLSGTPLPASSGLGVFAIPYIVSGH
jgi:hypothetical protein